MSRPQIPYPTGRRAGYTVEAAAQVQWLRAADVEAIQRQDTMAKTIKIDPVTRIEGHLAVDVDVTAGKVVSAHSSGEMFRGFETILTGRDPLDAQQITQRICGICPISHAMASVLAQDQAYGIIPPDNGRLLRNLIAAANFIQSHLTHFYHLSALDFVDIAAVADYSGSDPVLRGVKSWVGDQVKSKVLHPAAPLLPRYEGRYLSNADGNMLVVRHYVEALEMRRLAHKMGALFAGKLPHAASIVPGGVTQPVTAKNLSAFRSMLKQLRQFINRSYLPDVLAVAKAVGDYFSLGAGYGNFMSFGVFPGAADGTKRLLGPGVVRGGKAEKFDPAKITEDVRYSRFSSPTALHPSKGQTQPDPAKADAYSWIKAPRYGGQVMEVGPLARMMVAYHSGDKAVVSLIDGAVAKMGVEVGGLVSVMGRHAARAVECKLIADTCVRWVDALRPGTPDATEKLGKVREPKALINPARANRPTCTPFEIPNAGVGVGLTEAPRGALGHWLTIDKRLISAYQVLVPTTWNCSPRDDAGKPGAVEQALVGTPIADPTNPLEAARVVRSFDPCTACAVH